MDKKVALERALSIASLLKSGQGRIQSSSLESSTCGLLALLPIYSVESSANGREDLADIQHEGDIFREILIFGSVARGEPIVGDLDMIILDSGYCSPFFEPRGPKFEQSGCWYSKLRGNLYVLLTGWFGFKEWEDFSLDVTTDVDLHILPLSVLWSAHAHTRIAKLHTDPRFLENAFSVVLRYNEHMGQFIPTTFEELRVVHQPGHVTP